MSHKTSNPLRAALLSVLLATSACQENEQAFQPNAQDDRQIMRVVLEHFSARKDIMSIADDGIILVRPETRPGVDENLTANDGSKTKCEVPEDALTMSFARSQSSRGAAEIINESPKWKVATPTELEQAGPIPKFGAERTLPEVKTVVAVSIPGYSDNGRVATAVMSFSWSIHSAYAQYLLERAGKDWKVTCSKLAFLL
jgi:hypothetical protein